MTTWFLMLMERQSRLAISRMLRVVGSRSRRDKTAHLDVGYRSQGLNEWRYSFGSNDVAPGSTTLALKMKTNFKDIDFPDNTLSPSEKHETDNGWDLTWVLQESGFRLSNSDGHAREVTAGTACRQD